MVIVMKPNTPKSELQKLEKKLRNQGFDIDFLKERTMPY